MKPTNELKKDKQLLIEAINILDKITEEETNKKRTDDDFKEYETWAVTDVKAELNAKIGEIQVLLEYTNTEEENNNTETITEN